MWRLHDKKDAEEMKTVLLTMKGNVPSLTDIEVGINISKHNAAYDIVFMGSFKNADALAEFETDEFHKSIGKFVNKVRESRVVVEYEY
ncbi:hypothetical protein A9Q99_17475 [Gammaproteobacteria bacterium 45_16_T64]|nr:hypothetical protein A9Q99_17475 [Gammaproteobacteria bacterium 45_16_T64]